MLDFNCIYVLPLTILLFTSAAVNPTDLAEAGTSDLPQVIGCSLCDKLLEMVAHRFKKLLFFND